MQKLNLRTQRRTQLLDITRLIREAVAGSRVQQGFCYIFVPHTTAALTINEGADPTVARDLERALEGLVPWEGAYAHAEGNSAAHIRAALLGHSQWLRIEDGRLQLGTWQGVFFCEFDGPRQRQVWLQVLPEAVVDAPAGRML